jgi:hypothetical protein
MWKQNHLSLIHYLILCLLSVIIYRLICMLRGCAFSHVTRGILVTEVA